MDQQDEVPRKLPPPNLSVTPEESAALDQMPPTTFVEIEPDTEPKALANSLFDAQRRMQHYAETQSELRAELTPYVHDNQLTMNDLVRYLQSTSAIEGNTGAFVYDGSRMSQMHAKLAYQYIEEQNQTNAHQQSVYAVGEAIRVLTNVQLALPSGVNLAAEINPEALTVRLAQLPDLTRRDPNNPEPQR